jgi:hypothetical protein
VALHRFGESGQDAVRVANEEQVFHLAVSLSDQYARFGMGRQEGQERGGWWSPTLR